MAHYGIILSQASKDDLLFDRFHTGIADWMEVSVDCFCDHVAKLRKS